MLVLTRRVNEAIMIGEDVVVRVIGVRGRGGRAAVKLGIDAPSDTKILREEVETEVANEMMQAKDPVINIDDFETELAQKFD